MNGQKNIGAEVRDLFSELTGGNISLPHYRPKPKNRSDHDPDLFYSDRLADMVDETEKIRKFEIPS